MLALLAAVIVSRASTPRLKVVSVRVIVVLLEKAKSPPTTVGHRPSVPDNRESREAVFVRNRGPAAEPCIEALWSVMGYACPHELEFVLPSTSFTVPSFGVSIVSCIKLCVVVAALGGTFVCSHSQAAVFSLSDWGISLDSSKHFAYAGGYGYNYPGDATHPKQGSTIIGGNTVVYDLEDSNDNSNSYTVGPLNGGQNYDAEALLVSVVGSNLHIGIASGQRPDNGVPYYAPGDICITKGSQTWGIEVGGGPGKTTTPSPPTVVGGQNGTTYTLDSDGYTQSSTQLSTQEAGSIWEGGTWHSGIGGSGLVHAQLLSGGTLRAQLGASDYIYNFDDSLGQHGIIEVCIPDYQTVFGNTLAGATIAWAPSCGNDQLSLSVVVPAQQPEPVPEPASVVIWTVLLLTTVYFGRKTLQP
jgi:hypothetical protein